MGFELKAQFKDVAWYNKHRQQIKAEICKLPSFVSNTTNEFWLKDTSYGSSWDFDVRLFLEEQSLLIEVSAFSKAFTDDVRSLYIYLAEETQVVLLDDDAEAFCF